MKLKVDGTLEVPNVVASLFLGIPVNKSPCSEGYELVLDQQGLDKLSFILGILYADAPKGMSVKHQPIQPKFEQPIKRSIVQESVIQVQPPPTQPVMEQAVANPPITELKVPVVEQKAITGKKSLKDLAAKSKKFIG